MTFIVLYFRLFRWLAMLYTVFVSIPTKIEVSANSAEEAERIVRDRLIASRQIKTTDFVEINVAEEIKVV